MRTLKPLIRAATLAAALSAVLAVTGAQAEAPGGGPGPRGAHMRMPGGAGGIEGAIQHARAKLNLTAEQSAQLDAIIASAKSQAKAAHDASQATLADMKAELAKAQPNLRKLAQLQDSLAPQRDAIRKSVRDQMLNFYDTLNATQQQTVIDGVRRMASLRERIAQRWTGQ